MRFYTLHGIVDEYGSEQEELATPRQLSLIEEVAATREATIPEPLDELTKTRASEIIGEVLQKEEVRFATPGQLEDIESLAGDCKATINRPLGDSKFDEASEIMDDLANRHEDFADGVEDPMGAEISEAIQRAQSGDVGVEQPEDELDNTPLWTERIP